MSGVRDVRLVVRQIYYEQLAFWLNPIGSAFTVVFSVLFLVLLGATDGNQRISQLGNIRVVQYYVPGFAAYGVMAACFNLLAIQLVIRREMGLLKRLRLSPLPTWVMLGGIFGNAVIISFIEVVLVVVIGRLGYHVHFPGNPAAFAVALIVGAVCFTSIGVAASTLVPNQDSAGPMVSIVFFVLLFLSGLWYPIKQGSGLAKVSAYFPVSRIINASVHAFDLQRGVAAWDWTDIKVMAIWAVGGIIVALRRWRWEPRRG